MLKKIIPLRVQFQTVLNTNVKRIHHSTEESSLVQAAKFHFESLPQTIRTLNSFSGSSFRRKNPINGFYPHHLTPGQRQFIHTRAFSTQNDKGSQGNKNGEVEEEPIVAMYDESGNKLSNWARMKMMAKAYGYVIIPVHWVIAPVWFGSFYLAVKHGIDIVPVLKSIGVSEVYLSKLQHSGASDILQAYAMYKVATPARYTLTLAATEMTIRALRKRGFMKPLPPKEKTYRESMQETYAGMKEKMEDVKGDVKDKMDDVKDKMSDVKDKMSEVRDKLKEGEKSKQN
ncbi:uncharacterized protein C18orf19 homolog A-like [Anneissia japonica]|uniref:uncharacterized protein C18orf19 homolog A-like n=1 Tax=Anneissia japonica TaxID=1529436 RepID=UPI0014255F8F|nr:uncharacterized protein C18orf19 homolog A-like [Anneissia japonica]